MQSSKFSAGLATGIGSLLLAIATTVYSAGTPDGSQDQDTAALKSAMSAGTLPNNRDFLDPDGFSASFSKAGSINLTGAFFQSLGTNGRACVTCHEPNQGWTVSALGARFKFDETQGNDALFQFDGQNCVGADRSTVQARRAASSLMLNKAVVRFMRAIAPTAEFESIAAEGTYCNTTDNLHIVIYRRPPPTTNFGSLNTVFWDNLGSVIAPTIDGQLSGVAVGATQLHAQTSLVISNEQIADIVGFMRSPTTAQTFLFPALRLDEQGGLGGPENLANADLTGPSGFNTYAAWTNVSGNFGDFARRSIARGEALFNTRPINITGVAGLADRVGTCAGCHSVPNIGNSKFGGTLGIGTADAAHRSADLPLYTLRNKTTLETVKVSDPGAALVTGRWADIGRFKVPQLRALAARAPYFHNGIARDLREVVDFYDTRFNIGLSHLEKEDLVSFLRSL